jgi:diacylglycerol O-acyltransferase
VSELSFPKELEPFDYMMLRSEHDPRARSGFLAVSVLESVPDFREIEQAYDRASRIVLRLRQKVVAPTLPLAAPRWVVDPDFDLSYHMRRVVLPPPGRLRDLLDFAQPILASPFDLARPLWETILVEGLQEGGAAALLMKTHHAVMDGMAAVELFKQLFDFAPDADRGPLPRLPVPEEVSPGDLTRAGLIRLPFTAVSGAAQRASGAVRVATRAARDPGKAAGDLGKTLQSAQRVFGSPPAPPSPLLRRRGIGRRFEALAFPLDDLRRAAKGAGGSVNDAYLAGVCAVLRRYHDALGVPVDVLPLAFPISTRSDDDPAGGNRFAGARIAAPVGETDPARRIQRIREIVLTARSEPAMNALGGLMPLMARLPTSVLTALASQAASTDVQASNVPGYPQAAYIAGVKVVRSFGFGPVPGVAMMITMTTMAGQCEVSVNYDTAAVQDQALFARCLQEGFDEVLASGGPAPALAVPAKRPAGKRSATKATAKAAR